MPRAKAHAVRGAAMNAETFVGDPDQAPKAKLCTCDPPWLERQEDGILHCIGCGRDRTRAVAA